MDVRENGLDGIPWIRAGEGIESPVFRQTFQVTECRTAQLRICGLGFFEAYLNGQKVSEDLLVPAWTDYEPRQGRHWLYPIHDTFSHRIYYLEYDVHSYLKSGENLLGVWLGEGWYNQRRRQAEGEMHYGPCKLCFLLMWTDFEGETHRIHSGNLTLWNESEIQHTNIYYGEEHDLRRKPQGIFRIEIPEEGWRPVYPAKTPASRLLKQTCPADTIIRTIRPRLLCEREAQRFYDCGENITGFVRVKLLGLPGAIAEISHSEEWNASEQMLDYASAGHSPTELQKQTDRYIAGEHEDIVFPHFTWHGFRYFSVTGPAQVLDVAVVHGRFPISSSFSCSNEVLNWLYETYVRTQLDNIHCGVPSDCPQRERLGYTGDGQITAEAALLTLNCRALYDKWMEDIVDGQDPFTGHVQHTAPFYGGGGGPGGWGGAIFRIPMVYYRYYGDQEFLRRYYPAMRRWLDYMESHSDQGLVMREEEGGWCLGDWCTPGRPPEIPEPFVNTYYYLKGLLEVLEAARILGERHGVEDLKRRIERCRAAMIQTYQDPETGSFCGGVNGADAFALDIGLGDERTRQALIRRYTASRILDTGIFGTDVLIDVLFRIGQTDLAYELLTEETDYSFARMKARGATTLWETWTGGSSHNHPMFGGVVRTLFTHILGIQQDPGSAGFQNIRIHPADVSDLRWAKGSITTPQGILEVEWRRQESGCMEVQHRWQSI